jgi:enoyl-CoA hydratase
VSENHADVPVLVEEQEGNIRYITLNRPEKLNALSPAVYDAIPTALNSAETDPETHVVVVRGAGKAFSSGQDLNLTAIQDDPFDERQRLRRQISVMLRFWDLPKPVIAQIHGYCLGAATQLASLCDLVFVATDAVIGWPPSIRVGGGSYLGPAWVYTVGARRAKEMEFLPGSRIDGLTAAEWGWANRAFEPDVLALKVRELAAQIAEKPCSSLALEKEGINRMVEASGFREWLLAAAESDAIGHGSRASRSLQEEIREEHGYALGKPREPRI